MTRALRFGDGFVTLVLRLGDAVARIGPLVEPRLAAGWPVRQISRMTISGEHLANLQSLLRRDPLRFEALTIVAGLNLPDCWIAAGFVRDAVWDHCHGFPVRPPLGDVDVIWFGEDQRDESIDREIEQRLSRQRPHLAWSVKNQARMHLRNADVPYASAADAMRHWPETATATGARIDEAGAVRIAAPFGAHDLFNLLLRPGPAFAAEKLSIFAERVRSKRWLERYPRLQLVVDPFAVAGGG
ncbi:nucleotidyltransferase family protein [Sphingomonas sp.]|uniref:nucleotidyltransferase family protein n=1 Tax=Sphingomonas sp. TaxID=28214 RepID=UPI002DD6B09B|nr:nucleotidyltransferase family protein [Sphingomonas sp.]